MYYAADKPHGLAFDPFKAIIAPRPIGWISTLDKNGIANLAPYSFFNALTSSPPMLMFSSESLKDSAGNARDTGEFSFSLATHPLQTEMNISSDTLPPEQSEYEAARLDMAPCNLISAPRVAASPASMECVTLSCTELKDKDGQPVNTFMVIGQVVGIHINDDFIVDGRFDTAAAQPLARCGYRDYAAVHETFELMRPTDGGTYTGVDR
ncbi:MAG: flavin reductase family protein [Granulosicoccus sp.]|nr:flavin reductase family protein [Granulosicoccus sp.]